VKLVDIQTLVHVCDDYISGKRKFIGKPEEETKQMLIEPLLTSLGWPSTHTAEYYDREYLGKIKGIEWKDIALIVDDEPRIFVETKACNDKHIDQKYAKDLLKYLKNYNSDKPETEWVSWGILTSFTETFVYHWSEPTTRPEPFFRFDYKELPGKIPELTEVLSPVGVRNNRLLNRFYETPGHRLDEQFLKDLKKWRKIIANAFHLKNPSLAIEQISEVSHIFLSRLIFLRRLEAIGVLKPRWVKSQYEAWKEGRAIPTFTLSEYIRMLFDGFWRFYDTELFQEQECDRLDFDDQFFEELLKDIDASPQRVREIVGIQEIMDKGLYGYNFMELSLDILGTVYERYLAHKLEFKKLNGGKEVVSIEETPELRQTEGAYFTPHHIVRFILDHTLAPRLAEVYSNATALLRNGEMDKAEKEMLKIERIKVLDPACGSGSFLIEAFEMITSAYSSFNEKVFEAFKGKALIDQKSAEYAIDKIGERVLLENLYGVDLDTKAVELTKLNLWLHHIDLNRGRYYYSGGAAKRRLLPPLDLNIQCGNSMVCHDKDKIQTFTKELARIKTIRKELREARSKISLNTNETQILTLQECDRKLSQEMKTIIECVESELHDSLRPYLNSEEATEDFEKPFDWLLRFPEAFDDGGFDVYVGNPPYINLYEFSGDFRDYLEKKDPEIFSNKNDILYHFYKLGVDLLKEGGRLGYITSRYFLEAENADKLRGWLPNNSLIDILIDWGNVELFQGINTRCVVMTLNKSTKPEKGSVNNVNVAKIKNWRGENSVLTDLLAMHIGTEFYQPPNVSIFIIPQSELTQEPWRLLSKEEKQFRLLIEKDAWHLGGKQGLCDMGMGMQTGLDEAFRVTRKEIASEKIPMDFVRKLVRNGDIRRYAIHDRDEFWIYTEDVDVDSLPDNHPVKKHLLNYHAKLIQRYPCRATEKQPNPKRKWYQYTVPNIKELFSMNEKLIVPYKAPSNRFAMDKERRISSMDVYVLAVKKEHQPSVNVWFLLAILNSSLMDYAYITFYGRRKKSEFDYYTGLIENIPIKKPSDKIQQRLSNLAMEITELNQARIALLDAFEGALEAEPNEEVRLDHYYDNATAYKISRKEALLKDSGRKSEDTYEVYHIGIEEIGSRLVFEVEFRKNGVTDRQNILEIDVGDKAVREFLLYSVKRFVEKTREKKMLGKEPPLATILKNVLVPKFKTNVQENFYKISSIMNEFRSKIRVKEGLSDIERRIVANAEQIDQLVAQLYGLSENQQKDIRELGKARTVSEYFDRLEEYAGFEDRQAEE